MTLRGVLCFLFSVFAWSQFFVVGGFAQNSEDGPSVEGAPLLKTVNIGGVPHYSYISVHDDDGLVYELLGDRSDGKGNVTVIISTVTNSYLQKLTLTEDRRVDALKFVRFVPYSITLERKLIRGSSRVLMLEPNVNQRDFFALTLLRGSSPADVEPVPIKREILGRNYVMVHQLGYPEHNLQLWKREDITTAGVIVKESRSGAEYLERLDVLEDGEPRFQWVAEPVPITPIFVHTKAGSYVAQHTDAMWETDSFYDRALVAQTLPDDVLAGILPQLVKQVGTQPYYLIDDFRSTPSDRIQFFSKSPYTATGGNQVDLVVKISSGESVETLSQLRLSALTEYAYDFDWTAGYAEDPIVIQFVDPNSRKILRLRDSKDSVDFFKNVFTQRTQSAMESQLKRLVQVTDTFDDFTLYLLYQMTSPTSSLVKYYFWSTSPAAAKEGQNVAFVSMTSNGGHQFLESLELMTDGTRTQRWSQNSTPVFPRFLYYDRKGNVFLAQPAFGTTSVDFYDRVLSNNKVEDRLIRFITAEIEGQTYYCTGEDSIKQIKFWTKKSNNAKQVELITGLDARGNTVYLRTLEISGLYVRAHFSEEPVLATTILRTNEQGLQYVLEPANNTNWVAFYRASILPRIGFDLDLPGVNSFVQVTAAFNGKTYYMLYQHVTSRVKFQIWSESPIYNENGTRVDLVTTVHAHPDGGTTTNYLKEAVKLTDNGVKFTWSSQVPAATVFKKRNPDNQDIRVILTQSIVFNYFFGHKPVYSDWNTFRWNEPAVTTTSTRPISKTTVTSLDNKNEPVGPGPNEPVGPGPNEPVGPGPNEPVGPGPNEPVGPGPNEPVGPGPNEPVGPGPNKRVGPGPNKPVGPGPIKPAVTTTSTGSTQKTTVIMAETDVLASIPPLCLWVAAEKCIGEKAATFADMPAFRTELQLSTAKRNAVVLRLLGLQDQSGPAVTSAVNATIKMTLAERNAWCKKSSTKDKSRMSSANCVRQCERFVQDATILYVKNLQSQQSACTFGSGNRAIFAWPFMLTAVAIVALYGDR